ITCLDIRRRVISNLLQGIGKSTMPRKESRSADYIRWSYELLFSLYAANFVVEFEGARDGSKFLDLLAAPLVFFDRHLSGWRNGRLLFPPSDVLPNELTYSSICLLALILFICLRLIGWSRLGKMLVDCIAITSLVVGPVLITISTRS